MKNEQRLQIYNGKVRAKKIRENEINQLKNYTYILTSSIFTYADSPDSRFGQMRRRSFIVLSALLLLQDS